LRKKVISPTTMNFYLKLSRLVTW